MAPAAIQTGQTIMVFGNLVAYKLVWYLIDSVDIIPVGAVFTQHCLCSWQCLLNHITKNQLPTRCVPRYPLTQKCGNCYVSFTDCTCRCLQSRQCAASVSSAYSVSCLWVFCAFFLLVMRVSLLVPMQSFIKTRHQNALLSMEWDS